MAGGTQNRTVVPAWPSKVRAARNLSSLVLRCGFCHVAGGTPVCSSVQWLVVSCGRSLLGGGLAPHCSVPFVIRSIRKTKPTPPADPVTPQGPAGAGRVLGESAGLPLGPARGAVRESPGGGLQATCGPPASHSCQCHRGGGGPQGACA